MKSKKGFTLLELLVVVLIIGILAGIALPYYRTSRDKARLAQYEVFVKSLADARKRLFLTTGDWKHKFEDLDIELPGIKSVVNLTGSSFGQLATFDWGYCYMMEPKYNWWDNDIFCGGFDLIGYNHTIQFHDGQDGFEALCLSSKDNPRGIKLCETFGETYTWGCFWGPDTKLVCKAKAARMN